MSTNYTQVTGLLGVNLEGNEQPAGSSDGNSGAPRVPVLTPIMISNNRTAVYCIAAAALNPASTVAFQTIGGGNGTVAATTDHTGTGGTAAPFNNYFYVTLNTNTAATGDYIWARTQQSIGL